MAFAGLLSPARRWLRFTKQWCRVLDDDHLPPLHASQFLGRHGPFAGMPDEVQERVLAKLVKAITDNCWFVVNGALETEDYERELSPESKAVMWSPEQMAFFICMILIVERMETLPRDEDVAVMVDQDDKVRRHNVDQAYDLITKNEDFGFRFRSILAGDHRRTVQLQGADLVVNQVYAHQRDRLVTQEQLRPLLLSILDRVPSQIITVTPELLRYYDDGIKEIAKRGLTYDIKYSPITKGRTPC